MRGGDGVSIVDFSEHGSIIVHKDIVDGGLMQFIPDDGKQSTARKMHKMLLEWGKNNNREIGLMVTAKKGWPTPCAICLLYTSPSPRDGLLSRMPSSA